MLIGIDFDNTIVSYDQLFYKVALEGGHIPKNIEPTKTQVRDYLRNIDKEDIWTEMQGYVYGARMDEADAFPGVFEFMRWAVDAGINLAIVSHKTKHPFMGKKYNLHDAARKWINLNLHDSKGEFISDNLVFFELTKEAKLNRAGQIACDYFIDDLPEILSSSLFPKCAKKILFDPMNNRDEIENAINVNHWNEIQCLIQQDFQKKK